MQAKDKDKDRTKDTFGVSIHISHHTSHHTDDDIELKNAPPGSPQGYFAHLPYYVRLYETLNGAFEARDSGSINPIIIAQANKITLNVHVEGKFAEIIRTTLEVLAVVVEIEGPAFHLSAQEVLEYLQACQFIKHFIASLISRA